MSDEMSRWSDDDEEVREDARRLAEQFPWKKRELAGACTSEPKFLDLLKAWYSSEDAEVKHAARVYLASYEARDWLRANPLRATSEVPSDAPPEVFASRAA